MFFFRITLLGTFSQAFYMVTMFLSVSDSSLSASICQCIQTSHFRTSKNKTPLVEINLCHKFITFPCIIRCGFVIVRYIYIYTYSLFLLLMYYLSCFLTNHPFIMCVHVYESTIFVDCRSMIQIGYGMCPWYII
jgi:hypothetical protein